MKYIFALLALVLLFNFAYTQCSDSCNEDTEDFFPTTGKCEKYPKSGETGFVDKCSSYYYDNTSKGWKCGDCELQYYHDYNANTCTDGGIQYCSRFTKVGTTFTCENCGAGYYLDGQVCTPNPTDVTDCLAYRKESDGKVKCRSCPDNLYLALQGESNACLDFPDFVTGCDRYYHDGSVVICDSCDNSYDGVMQTGQTQVCYKIGDKIPNCKDGYENGGIFTCWRCNSGMMAVNNAAANDECVANPATAAEGLVENCDVYRKDGTVSCVKCVGGFGLKSDGKCYDLGTAKIENCGDYEFENNVWKCDDCEDNYYADNRDNITKCSKCPENKKKNSSAELMKVSMVIAVIVAVLLL